MPRPFHSHLRRLELINRNDCTRGKTIKVSKYSNARRGGNKFNAALSEGTNNVPRKAAFENLMRVGVSVNFIGEKKTELKF